MADTAMKSATASRDGRFRSGSLHKGSTEMSPGGEADVSGSPSTPVCVRECPPKVYARGMADDDRHWSALTEEERHILACLCEDINALGLLALEHGEDRDHFDRLGAAQALRVLLSRGLAEFVEWDPNDPEGPKRVLAIEEARAVLADERNWFDPRNDAVVEERPTVRSSELWITPEPTDGGFAAYWPHREAHDPWPSGHS